MVEKVAEVILVVVAFLLVAFRESDCVYMCVCTYEHMYARKYVYMSTYVSTCVETCRVRGNKKEDVKRERRKVMNMNSCVYKILR